MADKNWVSERAFNTHLPIEAATVTVTGTKSGRRDDAQSIATCPLAWVVEKCIVKSGNYFAITSTFFQLKILIDGYVLPNMMLS